ncbi:MAG: nucleotidyltransferase domain-containing protein [Desulfamplus sp.]|nr:nucleotidyltransferase domain-containing protein [Desulfamplus sp.]
MYDFDFTLKRDIVSRLSNSFRLKDVILFGSHAYGTPHKESDIDIMVVLDEEGFAKNYLEKIDRRIKVANSLSDLTTTSLIDILVYTKDEWAQLLKIGSSFIKQINQNGIRLL